MMLMCKSVLQMCCILARNRSGAVPIIKDTRTYAVALSACAQKHSCLFCYVVSGLLKNHQLQHKQIVIICLITIDREYVVI